MDTNVNHYTKKELAAIENFMPQEIFDAVVIVPTGKNHDSGFGAMKFILCRNFKIVGCVSGWSDVLHINGIGGYGKEDLNMQKRVAWCVDCLPKSKRAAIELALIALRKQIAKRPLPTSDDPDVTYYQCPMCGSYEYDDYCGHCGQRLISRGNSRTERKMKK